VTLVQHDRNRRFAAACNSGVEAARGEIVVLLNNDTIPDKDLLGWLLPRFKDPQVFAVACAESDGEKISGRSGGDFKRGLFVHWRAKDQTKHDTLWVSGGSGAFRKSAWHELGGMDTDFAPAYEEDRDLSYRALKRGLTVLYEPNAKVFHKHGTTNVQALGVTNMRAASYRNHFFLVWKNITSPVLLLRHFLWLPYRLIIDSLRSNGLPIVGFGWALVYLPAMLRKRRNELLKSKVSDEAIIEQFKNA
jgi:GT2 family glycosyltransferase